MKKRIERLLIRFAQKVIAKYYPPRDIKMESAPIQHIRWQHAVTSEHSAIRYFGSEIEYQNMLKREAIEEFVRHLFDEGGISFTRREEDAPWGKEIIYNAELMYITPKSRATA